MTAFLAWYVTWLPLDLFQWVCYPLAHGVCQFVSG